ncbi:melatonin receptor type 1A-like [Tubulanus polymorphus]|uniref:melatonin receptor type 1A-like n=1 Tax=Tubulanus polymorphus TaxID=672921 RepID=UPI003DA3E40B
MLVLNDLFRDFRVWSRNGTSSLRHGNYWQEHFAMTVYMIFYLFIFIVVGFFGNLLIIAAVTTNQRLQTSGNVYIINLAIADLGVTLLVDGNNIAGVLFGHKIYIELELEWLCYLCGYLCGVFCFTSAFSLAAIALDRLFFLCHNNFYRKYYSTTTTVCMCLVIWSCSFVLCFPMIFGWFNCSIVFDDKVMLCFWDRLAGFWCSVFNMGCFILPIIIVFVAYSRIFLFVWRSKRELNTFSAPGSVANRMGGGKADDTATRLAKTFFIIFIIFVIMWLPWSVMNIVDMTNRYPKWMVLIFLNLGHANSAVNSLLYGATNRMFREAYKDILLCKLLNKKRNVRKHNPSTTR